MDDRLATRDMDRKVGGLLGPIFGEGEAGSPSNTMWRGPRPTSVPRGILIHPAVCPQYFNITDRQDSQDRHRSDSIELLYKRSPKMVDLRWSYSVLHQCCFWNTVYLAKLNPSLHHIRARNISIPFYVIFGTPFLRYHAVYLMVYSRARGRQIKLSIKYKTVY